MTRSSDIFLRRPGTRLLAPRGPAIMQQRLGRSVRLVIIDAMAPLIWRVSPTARSLWAAASRDPEQRPTVQKDAAIVTLDGTAARGVHPADRASEGA